MWNVILCTFLTYLTYLLLGGGMFMLLEGLEGIHQMPPNMSSTNFSSMERVMLQKGFTNSQISEIIQTWEPDKSFRFLGGRLTEESVTWSYINAFVFSFHLCSTIGYGDVAPKTVQGQLICICYGIVGIPIHMLFFKLLGGSYHEAYSRTALLVEGRRGETPATQVLAGICFFVPWAVMLVVVPSALFTYTDKWTFLEGIYYCFITLTTVGLGDYVSGEKLRKDNFYVLYKIGTLLWMMYGLAFFLMVTDFLSSICTKFCLFELEMREGRLKVFRVGLDIERLDLHFRLFKSEGVELADGIWSEEKEPTHKKEFQDAHLRLLSRVARHLQTLLSEELERKGSTAVLRKEV